MTSTVLAIILAVSIVLILVIARVSFISSKKKNDWQVNDFGVPFVIDFDKEKVFFDKTVTSSDIYNYREFFSLNRSIRSFTAVLPLPKDDELAQFIINHKEKSKVNIDLPRNYDTYFNYNKPNESYEANINFYDYDTRNHRLFGYVIINDAKLKEKTSTWLWNNLIIDSNELSLNKYHRFVTDRFDKRSFPYSIYMMDFSKFISKQNMEESVYNINLFKNELEHNKKMLITNISDSKIAVITKTKTNKWNYRKVYNYIENSFQKHFPESNLKNVFISVVSSSNLISKVEIKYSMTLAKFNLLARITTNDLTPIISDDRREEDHSLFEQYQSLISNFDDEIDGFVTENFQLNERNILDPKGKKKSVYISYTGGTLLAKVSKWVTSEMYGRILSEVIKRYSKEKKVYIGLKYSDLIQMQHSVSKDALKSIKPANDKQKITVVIEKMPVVGYDDTLLKMLIKELHANGIQVGATNIGTSSDSRKLISSNDFDLLIMQPQVFAEMPDKVNAQIRLDWIMETVDEKKIELIFENINLTDEDHLALLKRFPKSEYSETPPKGKSVSNIRGISANSDKPMTIAEAFLMAIYNIVIPRTKVNIAPEKEKEIYNSEW